VKAGLDFAHVDPDKEVSVTESEGTTQGGSPSSSGGSAPAARKRPSGARRKSGGTSRRKTSTRKKTGRTTTARRRRRTTKQTRLDAFLDDLAKRASRAGSTIADLSEEGADAARRTLGKVSASSRQTIARVKREWDRLDNTRKAQFMAGLLGALAATAAGVRKATRK
jgi:hypothetical protein